MSIETRCRRGRTPRTSSAVLVIHRILRSPASPLRALPAGKRKWTSETFVLDNSTWSLQAGSSGQVWNRAEKGSDTAMDLSWRLRGACRGLDPEIFYSAGEDEGVDRAKEVCNTCVVQQQCLEFALANRESEGIWGGATEKERRRILRQRRKTAAA
jgi:WhiB family redox-sensing transcriptional regulator